jgi:hypothetical protein
MTQHLAMRLQELQVDEGRAAGGLQVFALRWEAGGGPDYLTLDEGLAAGVLEVGEASSGGSVPTLKVSNKGERPVFLMAGEHLAGGKQNRVLNASLFVAGGSEVPIPVSCVERGRWAYRAPHFAGSGSSSHSELRRQMHCQATVGYRSGGTPSSDQGAVWREVDRKLAETDSGSATQYLHKAYEDAEVSLREVAEQLPPPEGACGAAFAYGGRLVGLDLFDRPATLARLWPKLVRAYAIDARVVPDGGVRLASAEVRAWLGSAAQAREEVFPSPGLGSDVRLEGPRLVGACLVVDEHPIHVEAFAREEQA